MSRRRRLRRAYKLSYEFSREPEAGEAVRPNLPCALGIEIGARMAKLAEPCLAEFKAEFPKAPPPCNECALVKGTAPNGTLETQGDVMKCLVEEVPFFCHKLSGEQPKRLCAGFAAMATTLPVAKNYVRGWEWVKAGEVSPRKKILFDGGFCTVQGIVRETWPNDIRKFWAKPRGKAKT